MVERPWPAYAAKSEFSLLFRGGGRGEGGGGVGGGGFEGTSLLHWDCEQYELYNAYISNVYSLCIEQLYIVASTLLLAILKRNISHSRGGGTQTRLPPAR